MAKELPFFKFEVSEWAFGRIQKQPLETQGAFVNLCCKYWHKLGELSWDDACLDFGQNHIETLEKNKIIGRDGEFIIIKFLDKQLDECQDTRNKNRIAGLASAQARAKRKSTPVERPLASVERKPTEEKRREEKRKEESEIREYGPTHSHFVIVKAKYLHEQTAKIYGKAGLIAYMEANQTILNLPEYADKFMRNNNGTVFNELSHLQNAYRLFTQKQ